MPALLVLLRAAIPFAATLFGGYFISDVFNERQKAIQATQKVDYPAIIGSSFKRRGAFWKFVAVAGLLVGIIIAFITKRLSK